MVFVAGHNILSPLGPTSAGTFEAIVAGQTAVSEHPGIFPGDGAVWASKLPQDWAQGILPNLDGEVTKFEKMLIASISDATADTDIDLTSERTVFVFATTKGNISLIEDGQEITGALLKRISLFSSAQVVSRHFGNACRPVVISNACISGVAALLYAQRLLQSGQYDTAIVAGADTVGKFVLSGFQAFQALSAGLCKPFSEDRDGINLGEAAATVVLTTKISLLDGAAVCVAGGAISNDANHISGPSRTGAELASAIDKAIHAAQIGAEDVDFISAHGTATSYNDAMEAKAFVLSGVASKPVNSIKGALGHTLGAAGVVESVLSVMSLTRGRLLPTAGYSTSSPMRDNPLNISTACASAPRVALKTASGFGGCNGALIFMRN
jgi:3-oxoacyl-[acyl-carrier-protein] synthase-1